MAEILPDYEIKRGLSSIIVNGDESLINPNGIELRLGKHVYFHSTDEEKELTEGHFLQVSPGETVLISSLEEIDFRKETVQKLFTDCMLMGLITPTTTMMREGISQVSTKIDAGFKGILNWSLRNGSSNKITLQYKEPIFKLTILKLSGSENPHYEYGTKDEHTYQHSEGIVRSTRKVPAQIPKNKLIKSDFENIDPKKTLKEAGYPFNYIGTELIELQGKFETVSTDVRLIKDQFDAKTKELTTKIETETGTLVNKLEDTKTSLVEKTEMLFTEKFNKAVGLIISGGVILYGILSFIKKNIQQDTVPLIAIGGGVIMLVIVIFVLGRTKKKI